MFSEVFISKQTSVKFLLTSVKRFLTVLGELVNKDVTSVKSVTSNSNLIQMFHKTTFVMTAIKSINIAFVTAIHAAIDAGIVAMEAVIAILSAQLIIIIDMTANTVMIISALNIVKTKLAPTAMIRNVAILALEFVREFVIATTKKRSTCAVAYVVGCVARYLVDLPEQSGGSRLTRRRGDTNAPMGVVAFIKPTMVTTLMTDILEIGIIPAHVHIIVNC